MSLIAPIAAANPAKQDGGRGGIRTHGGFPHARFRVECLKPDSATLPSGARKRRVPNVEHPISNATLFQIGRSAFMQSCLAAARTSELPGKRVLNCKRARRAKKCYNFWLAMAAEFT